MVITYLTSSAGIMHLGWVEMAKLCSSPAISLELPPKK